MILRAFIYVLNIAIGLSLNDKNFICKNSNQIDAELICDGYQNCDDASDETFELCFHVICPKNMYRCFYGACIIDSKRCDGINDCVDGSDELHCDNNKSTCSQSEYLCLSGECISNVKLCDGVYDCQDKSDEDDKLCTTIVCPDDTFHCKIGGCVHKEALCNEHNDCIDGSDESPIICQQINCKEGNCAQAFCPGINSTRLKVKCEEFDYLTGDLKGSINCNKLIPVATVAEYKCKEFYKPSSDYDVENNRAVCQIDGTWTRNILKCEPECGVVEEDAIKLIVHGWKATQGQWPWHAAFYCLEEGEWNYCCGGSLISEMIVLTAAHCVWETDIREIRVALGKYFSDFNKSEDYTQIFQIQQIFLQPLYQDSLGNYGSDIAVIVLNEPVKFSKFIRPICIDWNLEYVGNHLKENNKGMVVGLGVTENDKTAEHLQVTTLPIVSEENCIRNQKKDFKKYITYSTFCAGYQNGTGVCNGDSGGGLVFSEKRNEDKWFLQGIVSISPRRHGTSFCDPKYYTIFTKVSKYVDWLKDVLINFGLYLTDEVQIEEDIVY